MKSVKIAFWMLCFVLFTGQSNAQSFTEAYKASLNSLPTAQGWQELRFDNSMPWEEAAKALLVQPSNLTAAIAGTAFKLKAEEGKDELDFPLYSQLGYSRTRTGFSPSIGFTVEFKAKVINSPDGAFTVSGVGGGKGFRLEISNSLLTEHADVTDSARVLSTADNTGEFHTYRVAVHTDDKVYVWRDGVSLGSLRLQPFKLDNILKDGGFENGQDAAAHGWLITDAGKPGTLTVSDNPEYVHSGQYGLFIDKGFHKNDFIPVKPGAIYDMSAWIKNISYPTGDGHWRDFDGWHDPASDKSVHFVVDRNNLNWKYYEKTNMEGGAHFQRFIVETPTGDINDNQAAFDDLHYSERIIASRIPAGAVNLFPNGDFEDPCYDYFPAGDPRNDTCIVNPENYLYSADAFGREADSPDWFGGTYSAEHNAAPFWHPFWGARVRVQYDRQIGNDEAGNHWARGKYSLRYFNCKDNDAEYGGDITGGLNEERGRNSDLKSVPVQLEAGKKYTFLFSYHFAKWGGDKLIVVVKNGETELFRKSINNEGYNDWKNEVIEFTADADNHALQILTERDAANFGVVYFDDFFLFQGELLPEDYTHLFFGKQTNTQGAEVEIEYVNYDNTGAYDPAGNALAADAWSMKQAPLMTAWSETLNPESVLNEYPRPQLKRANWNNLNGLWDFTSKTTEGFGEYNAANAYRQQILVPYPVESAISGIMDEELTNRNKTYAYKRVVNIAKPTDGKRVILNFGAVDWESYVFVNGQEVAHHKGGFDPFSADITDKLSAGGSQEIVVQAFDPTRGGQPSGKQTSTPDATNYTPVSGIWQTVWTETVNPVYVTDVTLTPVDNNAVKVKVDASDNTATATVKVFDGATQVGTADVAAGAEATVAITSPKLWSPESPFLYNVKVELKKAGAVTDEVTSYFGLRKLEVKPLRDKPFVYLNGAPAFSFATLDHGYYPDGLYTPASYDAIRYDLTTLKESGFNAVRKFEKIEPAIWYYLADSLGLLVWQDIPAAHTGTPIAELNTEAARKENFLRETEAITRSIRHFPSIAAWIGFNDGWGQYNGSIDHTKNTVDLFRSLNDGRLVIASANGSHFELGDVIASNSKPLPTLPVSVYNTQAAISGITGGYDYVIDGHIWNTSAASETKNDSTYAARLKEFRAAAADLSYSGLSGLAIVQTTDVETEVNGLITYDRKVSKLDGIAGDILKEGADFLKSKVITPILKTSGQGGELWKYVDGVSNEVEVPADWNSSGFNDSGWKEGYSAFGGNMGVSFPWRTPWKGDNIELYLRKSVYIPQLAEGDELNFKIFYDEDYEFYINGVLANNNTSWSTNYVGFNITPEAKAAIVYGGENLFAVHIIQKNGGSCFDMGVTALSQSRSIDYQPETEPVNWKDIATAADWQNIRNDLNGFYRLTADISLEQEMLYSPIGETNAPFRGYIDGQNHTVTCPEIDANGKDRVGLFGYAVGAHFVNLRFTAGYVKWNTGSTGGADIGILLGRGKGITVEHVVFDKHSVYDTEISGRDHVGVVAGMLESGMGSTIKDVYVVDATVESSEWQAGGLVGIICDTRIINSYFTGTVAITRTDRETYNNADAAGIASRTEGGNSYFTGVMSLATSIESASGNEFFAFNGGGYISIDSTTCFTRDDMTLDELKDPARSGQFARAGAFQKRPEADFKAYPLYRNAGWDIDNVWGIPKGGGFPIFRYLGGDFEPLAIRAVEKKANDLRVYSAGGNIVLSASQPTAVWIYSLQGSLVKRTDVNGSQIIALPRGIYIVKSAQNGNVKAIKIVN